MKKKYVSLFLSIILLLVYFTSCKLSEPLVTSTTQKSIAQIDAMPQRAGNYKLLDFKAIALEVDRVLYAAAFSSNDTYNPETCMPVGYWSETNGIKAYGFPSYIGSPLAGYPGSQEGLTVMASLLGASYAGIDKSAQALGSGDPLNFIEMTKVFYNQELGLVLNNINGKTGQTFWYEILPQIQFIELYSLYPDEIWMEEIIIEGAEKWHTALPDFKNNKGELSFIFKSYDFTAGIPIYGTNWNEPPNGGLSYIFYNAYLLTGNTKFLDDVRVVLEYLENWNRNSYYEVLQDYAAYVAALMNFYHGTQYDIQKLINVSFEGETDFKRSSQIVNAQWGDYDAYGLLAFQYSDSNGQGYAFAMNTFHLAKVLAPTIKYDPRFANAIGKWFYHMTNSARLFYANEVPAENQSCPTPVEADPMQAMAYEGVKSNYLGQAPYLMGDQVGNTTTSWGGKTDYGIYGGALVGVLGGIIQPTNVEEVIQVNLSLTDSLATEFNYPCYLYYNPYDTEQTIMLDVSEESSIYDLHESIYITKKNPDMAFISIPPQSARVIVILPQGEEIEKTGPNRTFGETKISTEKPSVNILSPSKPKTLLSDNNTIELSFSAPIEDEIEQMQIFLEDELLYEGKAVENFSYGIEGFETGTYNLKVQILTKNGLTDLAMIRVCVV